MKEIFKELDRLELKAKKMLKRLDDLDLETTKMLKRLDDLEKEIYGDSKMNEKYNEMKAGK